MQCDGWPVAICSWSLRTGVAGVADAMRQLGIGHVNLALKPALREGGDEYLAAVRRQPWTITAMTIGFPQEDYTTLESIRASGGIVPDAYWPENRQAVVRAAEITAQFGVRYLTLHAGFLESDDAAHAGKIRDRLRWLADAAAGQGLMLLLETGQETADCLRALLEELNHPALGVNFDPANMILYDKGDPVAAVRMLGTWIKHVHVKDAVRTKQPGTWGTEVPWGEGEVGSQEFLTALKEIGYTGALAIEREAGNDRLADMRLAAERLADFS
ncbi:MAG TPA: sugar phosphate isomerase/epimerase family protein [Candidatus Anammoximicrobium sp.]|nr:sugar phosphate isomerase/epimerase family protein [Candidatus Anammoximicrobium sp.]